ncbi:MAG: copper ion binding protein, partial [Gemmatimonadaceae bacterium]|nr:copper ion binding protein [Acetobacteraceae bacterium]
MTPIGGACRMDQAIMTAAPTKTALRWTVGVTGMSCAACVGRVERAAAAIPGVANVSVNLATERASIEVTPEFHAAELATALRSAGYPVIEDTIDLTIAGMTCASCSGRVERAVLSVPGVLGAAVNLATEQARVRVLAGVARTPALLRAVKAAGYSASAVAGNVLPVRVSRDGPDAALACLLAAPLVLPMLL